MSEATNFLLEANRLEGEIKNNAHIIHIILTILTGFWVFVWIGCALHRKSVNDKIRARINRLERNAIMVKGEA